MTRDIWIGWDSRAAIAYDVAAHSIARHAKHPEQLRFHALKLDALREDGILTRPVERRGNQLWCPISNAPMSTEFAISRFAVPLIQQKGWALFVDCDIICYAPIEELFAQADPRYAVQVVKHRPQGGTATSKMDGQIQTYYDRKNWSSVVLWNCSHPSNARLTHEVLNGWAGRGLHAFRWLADHEIGELPATWNHLVDVDPPMRHLPNIAHLTLGGPWFAGWKDGQGSFDAEWNREQQMLVVNA